MRQSVSGEVRSTSVSGNNPGSQAFPGGARTGREQPQQTGYLQSITSSARASSEGGTSRPNIIAVAKLMTSSNLLACTIGKSAGFVPLSMRPA